MIIQPKVRGFLCVNAHPEGCAQNVAEQIDYIESLPSIENGPKNVLIIGGSTGYGLSSAITAAFGSGSKTLSIFFEKAPKEKRTGSAGYYNASAFQKEARAAGLYAKAINGDAFSTECKEKTIACIKQDLGSVDLVIYSLASPRRTDPETGETYSSVLKPIGEDFVYKGLNTDTLEVSEMRVEAASEEEVAATVKVMGGEDWQLWIEALGAAGVLSENAETVAYTYLGEKVTWPIYGQGTIGKAKEDLDRVVAEVSSQESQGEAKIAVLKALVTQASSAIPTMPIYLSLLYKLMKEKGTHEGCIEQIYRLFSEGIYNDSPRVDDNGRYRMDNLELDPEVQRQIVLEWEQVTSDNLLETTDFVGYKEAFLKLFGFGRSDVDYEQETSPLVILELE